jgi:hypothetical protein
MNPHVPVCSITPGTHSVFGSGYLDAKFSDACLAKEKKEGAHCQLPHIY